MHYSSVVCDHRAINRTVMDRITMQWVGLWLQKSIQCNFAWVAELSVPMAEAAEHADELTTARIPAKFHPSKKYTFPVCTF